MSDPLTNSEAPKNKGEAEVAEVAYEVGPPEKVVPVRMLSGRAKRRERRLRHEPSNVTLVSNTDTIHLVDFLEARSSEINSMLTSLRGKGGSKRTFQKLPRHMRRRAVSHNPKRLPRRFRDKATKEVRNCYVWPRGCLNV